MIYKKGSIEVCCNGDIGTKHYETNKESKMIFELNCNEEGDIYFNAYADREEWLIQEKKEIVGTILEQDSEKYLAQFIKTFFEGLDLDKFVGKILIEGKIIVPKIKSTINVLDL